MVNKAIPDLPTAGLPLTGTEQIHGVQNGNSREVNLAELANFIGRGGTAYGLGHARFSAPGDAFTAVNNGTPVRNGLDSSTGHWVLEHEADDEISYALQTGVAAGDFDRVFTLSCQMFQEDAGTVQIGLAVGDGTNVTTFSIVDTAPLVLQKTFRGTDRFTFVSTPTTVTLDGAGPFGGFPHAIWLRVTRVGTAVTFYTSPNGFDWDEVLSGTDTENGMASITEVGVAMSTDGVTDAVRTLCRVVGLDTQPQGEARSGSASLPQSFQGFRAEANATQAVTAATDTVMVFGNEVFDTENGLASNVYTVPASLDGKYGVFFAGCRATQTADLFLSITIERDDQGGGGFTPLAQGLSETGDANGAVPVSTGVIQLVAGHQYRVSLFSETGSTTEVQNDVRNQFSMAVVDSPNDVFDYVVDASASRTLTAADFVGNRTLEMTNAGAIALTLDTGVSAAGPLTVIQGNTGAITVGGTATVQSKGGNLTSNGQESAFTIVPTNTADTYKAIGDLIA